MSHHAVSRRTFLRSTFALSAVAASGVGLTACAAGETVTGSTGSAAVPFPTYRAYTGVQPDLPGTAEGVMNAFFDFPKERPVSVPKAPGAGETVSAMSLSFAAPPTPMAQNSMWQDLNQRLGVTLDISIVPADAYVQRQQTTIAGDDLPDLVTFTQHYPVPDLAALLQAKFIDLSEYLSGDKVLAYPNLANIPTDTWLGTRVAGRLWGLPIPRTVVGGPTFLRTDLLRERGITTIPTTLEDYEAAMREVTDPKAGRWGLSEPGGTVTTARMAYGSPNGWAEEGGKFVHESETDAYVAGLEWATKMHGAGLGHPDAVAQPGQLRGWFASGAVVSRFDSFTGWRGMAEQIGADKIAAMPPLTSGSTGGRLGAADGFFGFTAISKGNEDRIDLILRVADYLAAPFGTKEAVANGYGKEGEHFTVGAKGPELTDKAKTEREFSARYLTAGPDVIFIPGAADLARTQHTFQTDNVPKLLRNASSGLHSDSWLSRRAQMTVILTNGMNDIVAGRKPVSAWKSEILPAWRSAGGDRVRQEFQDAKAAVG